jgi:hypothetical protein
MKRPSLLIAAVALTVLGSLGCQSELPDRVTPEGTVVQSRLTAIHWLYSTFRQKRNRTPKDAAELQKFGLELPSVEGGPVSLTDAFLVSPRDQKPIVVRYGLDLSTSNTGKEPLLAYEEDGVNGRRFVVYAVSGNVTELDSAAFEEAR